MNNYLLIVDATNLLNRCYYADPTQRYVKGNIPVNAIEGFLRTIVSIMRRQKPSHIAFCFDTGSRNTFRKVIYDGYKSGRKDTPEDLLLQYTVIEDILRSVGLPVFVSDRNANINNIWEGDDFCGSIAKKMRYKIPEICITTKDHDYFQLIESYSDNEGNIYKTVVWMNTTKAGEYYNDCGIKSISKNLPPNTFEYNKDNLKKLTGMTPEQVIEYKAIVGDSSDSIPGVPGVGKQSGISLLIRYKGIDELYDLLESLDGDELAELALDWKDNLGIRNSKSLIKKLIAGKDMAYLSRGLATIKTDIPLNITIEDLELKINTSKWNDEMNKLEIYDLYM